MGEVVSLNRARKAKARATRQAEAGGNRAKFGRTKAARTIEAAEETRRASLLNGAKRDDSGV